MEYLIAHKEDCGIITDGSAMRRQLTPEVYQLESRPCTCGGVKVSLQDLIAPPKVSAVGKYRCTTAR